MADWARHPDTVDAISEKLARANEQLARETQEREQAAVRLEHVLSSARCLLWHADVEERDGNLVWATYVTNPEAVRQFLPLAVSPGGSYSDAFYRSKLPEDAERMDQTSFDAIRSGKRSYSQEYRCRRVDGETRWLLEDARIEPIGCGRWHLTGVCTDITERKRAEEALRYVTSHACCILWDAEVRQKDGHPPGHYVWSIRVFDEEAAQRLLPLEVRAGQSYCDAWYHSRLPEDRERCDRVSGAALLAGSTHYIQEFRCRGRDGEIRWLNEQAHVERLDQGRFRIAGVCTDVTESKRLGEQLAHRLRLEHAVAHASRMLLSTEEDGVTRALGAIGAAVSADRAYVFLSRDGGTRMDNTHEWCAAGVVPQMGSLQGLDPAAFPWWMEHLRRNAPVVVDDVAALPEEASAERGILQAQSIQAVAAVPMWSQEGLIGFAGFDDTHGTRRWSEEDLAVLRTAAGTLASCVERQRAKERHQQLEEELRQAQKMEAVGRLAGGVAHDFNNLLTPILTYADLLRVRLDVESPLHGYAQEIARAGERAAALTRQLLAFSRRQVLQPRVLDPNSVVADVQRMLTHTIGEDVEITTVVDPATGLVKADPGQLEQVILNLTLNARDAMPRGGKLVIGIGSAELTAEQIDPSSEARPGAYVMLSVSDTGCGMDEHTLSHLFEPFFTTKELGRGTGLGLATVYGIVAQSGGCIHVRSRVGVGTTVQVYLPRVDGAPDGVDELAPPELADGGMEAILVVEDEASVREAISATLEMGGYRVLSAASGADALRVSDAHADPIHLLLTDVVMPGMGGRELAERLGPRRPDMRVVYMSGYTEDTIVHHGVRDQGVPFLHKPFTPGALLAKVREVLNDRQGRRAPT